ncbi:MAG: hypothetical protein ACI8PT_001877 [Gammaproteobacteria bacterium]|jgi:hypothetical protein
MAGFASVVAAFVGAAQIPTFVEHGVLTWCHRTARDPWERRTFLLDRAAGLERLTKRAVLCRGLRRESRTSDGVHA